MCLTKNNVPVTIRRFHGGYFFFMESNFFDNLAQRVLWSPQSNKAKDSEMKSCDFLML